ncbi:MAG: hypothetical protein EPO02_09855, partial [Nitrospirae bacterium]
MSRPRAYNNLRACLAVLGVVLVFGAAGVPSVAAKELFKDEAGRLIYAIDDDGVVSMFESSPGIDVTLSVTRGTRAEMQPKVAEVSPDTVSAGTSHLLKIKGKNLVGATVKWNGSGIEMGPYVTKPTVLEIPLRVAPNTQPGDVAFQVTTPIGRTQATLRITEMQIGGGGMAAARREKDQRKTIPTSAPASCPDGMVGVAAESGGFCIEVARSFSGDIRKAEKSCAMTGKRLCQVNEWREACEQARNGSLSLKDIIGNWE